MTTLERWRTLWRALGARHGDEALFEQLIRRYREPHRRYHTLQHLAECLHRFDELRGLAQQPAQAEIALWFHDAVYDIWRNDNEQRSADWARQSVLAQRPDAGSTDALDAAAAHVHGLVMATRHSAPAPEADARVVVDVDLWILGADPVRFDEYERQIREEYRHIPDLVFRPRRAALLERLLARPRLFSTEPCFERFEARARANIARSIALLR